MGENDASKIFPIINIGPLHQKYIIGDASLHEMHNDPDIKYILTQITDAFTEWGFVYLVDHGIESRDAFKEAKEFFEKEKTFKSQYTRTSNKDNWGYVPYKLETFDQDRPFDLKEAFNFTIPYNISKESKESIKEFIDAGTQLSDQCRVLATMLMRVLSPALNKDDQNLLINTHQHIGNINTNRSNLRLLYYPSIEREEDIPEKQLRCGEHSDYGTITLLFQDDVGGLQVVSPTGEYVDAVPVPGSIVVNVADLMEIWTSGKFRSTRHRVLIKDRHDKARQSIAYFVNPDNDVEVSCLDGSDRFESVNAYDYLMQQYRHTYTSK